MFVTKKPPRIARGCATYRGRLRFTDEREPGPLKPPAAEAEQDQMAVPTNTAKHQHAQAGARAPPGFMQEHDGGVALFFRMLLTEEQRIFVPGTLQPPPLRFRKGFLGCRIVIEFEIDDLTGSFWHGAHREVLPVDHAICPIVVAGGDYFLSCAVAGGVDLKRSNDFHHDALSLPLCDAIYL
ncbi:hypothetical protein A2333_00280 [Candidatus Wolfebacteria bacterium RIFOXYB2_FULL_49_7]|uniref:Uncharacterized protein n=1 Tax=Candidatus Wolfebacteria bacterium RIFOXYB1_FULL_54_12 TaxID=1802559 RepID=A0A1F8DWK4_9BACT|nr:MAG: hypothetical protein A2372_03525 [Candidatus Wolfebacteria bacterium RIFOXYB1_FULL_54_12]OGM93002.1 MAG: hypothetical protein A2333_00280 [Candidatus Wolfebacteria bacterium RIFOXYB2_FULL_49_7]